MEGYAHPHIKLCVYNMSNVSVIMVASVFFVLFSVWKAWRDETRYVSRKFLNSSLLTFWSNNNKFD